MAYYDDGYIWAQEHTTFFPVAHQDPVSFSNYETYGYVDTNYDASNVCVFNEPKSIDHGYEYDYSYNDIYDYDKGYDYGDCHDWYSSPNPDINYLAHNYMEPKLIAYESVECDTGYVNSYQTQHLISYSKMDPGFNEPEFEEYDPTPYDGGYDIISAYGKPLPPSDKTCYPRSKPKPVAPRPTPNSIAPTPTPTPNSDEPRPTPNSESLPNTKASPKPEPEPEPMHMPIATPIPLPKPEPKPKPEPEPVHALVPVPEPLELNEVGEREKKEYNYPGYGYDYPWPEYDNVHAIGAGYDYGYGKQVVQIPPCEYSPEVVDFCESIFGSWPCLARIRKQQMGVVNNSQMSTPEIGQRNPWEECASYFFGRPIPSYNV
ncbi:putative PLD-regulated protein1 [Helianthus debilis subsp. tardiflorus]